MVITNLYRWMEKHSDAEITTLLRAKPAILKTLPKQAKAYLKDESNASKYPALMDRLIQSIQQTRIESTGTCLLFKRTRIRSTGTCLYELKRIEQQFTDKLPKDTWHLRHKAIEEAISSKQEELSNDLLEYYSQGISPQVKQRLLDLAIWAEMENVALHILRSNIHFNLEVDDPTPLYRACRNGLQRVVPLLLEAGLNLDEEYESSPLLEACKRNHEKIAALLVRLGANLDAQDTDRNTPLHLALKTRPNKIISLLLARVTNLEVRNKLGETPLLTACTTGNEQAALALIRKGANVHARDSEGRSPLALACAQGLLKVVEQLYRPDLLEQRDYKGYTLLHTACRHGQLAVVEFLLAHDPDVNRKIDSDYYFLTGNLGNTPLISACEKGSEEVVQALLKRNPDIHFINKNGKTALHWAAYHHLQAAWELIQRGADLHAIDNSGRSILHIACDRGNESLALYLIKNGVDPFLKDRQGNTPLYLALSQQFESVILALLDKGEVDFSPPERIPLQPAFGRLGGHFKTVSIQPEAPTWTPLLLLACWRGHFKAALVLMDRGAPLHSLDNDGDTPVKAACLGEEYEITKELIRRGGGIVSIWNWPPQEIKDFCIELFSSIPSLKDLLEKCEKEMDLREALQANAKIIVREALREGSAFTPLEVAFLMHDQAFSQAVYRFITPAQYEEMAHALKAKHLPNAYQPFFSQLDPFLESLSYDRHRSTTASKLRLHALNHNSAKPISRLNV